MERVPEEHQRCNVGIFVIKAREGDAIGGTAFDGTFSIDASAITRESIPVWGRGCGYGNRCRQVLRAVHQVHRLWPRRLAHAHRTLIDRMHAHEWERAKLTDRGAKLLVPTVLIIAASPWAPVNTVSATVKGAIGSASKH